MLWMSILLSVRQGSENFFFALYVFATRVISHASLCYIYLPQLTYLCKCYTFRDFSQCGLDLTNVARLLFFYFLVYHRVSSLCKTIPGATNTSLQLH